MAPFLGGVGEDTDSSLVDPQIIHLKAASILTKAPSSKSKTKNLRREPMKLTGLLDTVKSSHLTPIVGTEFPTARVVDWMKASNADEILRELAVTSTSKTAPSILFRASSNIK